MCPALGETGTWGTCTNSGVKPLIHKGWDMKASQSLVTFQHHLHGSAKRLKIIMARSGGRRKVAKDKVTRRRCGESFLLFIYRRSDLSMSAPHGESQVIIYR